MNQDSIAEVSIDALGRLHIRPTSASFPHVWRAAMEVYWDEAAGTLHSPTPRTWSYSAWFCQIIAAVKDEYGYTLELSPHTSWVQIQPDTRDEIIAAIQPTG